MRAFRPPCATDRRFVRRGRSPVGSAEVARRPGGPVLLRRLLPLLLLFVATPVAGQEDDPDVVRTERSETLPLATRDLLDPDPLVHMGWGTAEDVFVDLGAGAGVSLLSGNLVMRVEPLRRPDLHGSARMALTYNHQEPEGTSDLAPGWTYDLARTWMPGAWGERVLLDGDGFRDVFWAGDPPTADELDRVTRDVVDAWRRDTPAPDRRALGGVRALQELLVSDPTTLGAMRLRYLGAPDLEVDEKPVYRSLARGARVFRDDPDDGVVLELPDGTRELYDEEGRLVSIQPQAGLRWDLKRDNGVLKTATLDGRIEWSVETDSRFRLHRIGDSKGGVASIEYSGSMLQVLETPGGDYRFRYDGRSRLAEARTPMGVVSVVYDDATGRVRAASGPAGDVSLRAAVADTGIRVDVDGLAGGTWTVVWDAERRRRTVSRAGRQVEAVRFAEIAALPEEVALPSTTVTFDWDGAGRLVRAAQPGREVVWERESTGALTALVDSAGQRGVVESDSSGLKTWTDPAGRRTTLERADDGHVRAVGRTGGPDLSLKRHPAGTLSLLAVGEGTELVLPSPERGVGEVRLDGASGGVRRAVDGRILSFEGSGGRTVGLVLGADGRVQSIRDDRTSVSLSYAGTLLSAWSGPEGSRTIRRGVDGIATALLEGGAPRWEARRGTNGAVDRLLLDGAELSIETSAEGPTSWGRPGGASTRVQRATDGAVDEVTDSASGTLLLELDPAGRTVGVRRGAGRWGLPRDRSGRLQRVAPPGGAIDFTLDDAGHPSSLGSLAGLAWRIRRDAVGRMTSFEAVDSTFGLELERGGAPRRFLRPDGVSSRLTYDVRGRWTGIGLPDGSVAVSWGVLGPTAFGELRWRLDSSGALVGWGRPGDGELRWFADRQTDGRVRAVRGPSERVVRREASGRPILVGDLRLDWAEGGLEGFTDGDETWRIERDGVGRIRRISTDERGVFVVEREVTGDVRTVSFGPEGVPYTRMIGRDPAGRVETLSIDGDGTGRFRMERDPSGRMTRIADGEDGFVLDLRWRDVVSEGDDLIAAALDVQTDDSDRRREASGAWDATLTQGGRVFVRHEERPPVGGRLSGPRALPSEVEAGFPSQRIAGTPFVPSKIPPAILVGDAARAERWWTGRAPRAEDLALMPEGLPESLRAWRHARLAARTASAGVPDDVVRAGAGALLPPVPGATALVPSAAGARRVAATEALVLSGDLPGEALLWGDLLDLPLEPWTLDLPGAAVLSALRPRIEQPLLPPGWDPDRLAVVQPGAHGLLTVRGRDLERRRDWDVRALVEGLPPGTVDVLPGTPGWVAPMPGSTAADGRATVWDSLSDDPFGAREAALGQATSDSVLLALRALASGTPTAMGGLLPDPVADESWLIELPSGTRVVLDGHGRLLSIDAGGRLLRSHAGAMSAIAARELLTPTLDRWLLDAANDQSPWNPRYLPGRGAAVESRWGLVPAVPLFPLDSQGRPALPGLPR